MAQYSRKEFEAKVRLGENLENVDLSNLDLRNAKLRGANLSKSKLTSV